MAVVVVDAAVVVVVMAVAFFPLPKSLCWLLIVLRLQLPLLWSL